MKVIKKGTTVVEDFFLSAAKKRFGNQHLLKVKAELIFDQ
jgi:hypothetical protein